MTFPAGFQAKYLALLGPEEGQAFLDSFKLEAESGFRVNPLKASQSALPESAQPMPGNPWGYYGKVAGSSTAHVTGLVYSQEPAAQMVGQGSRSWTWQQLLGASRPICCHIWITKVS